MHFPSQNLAGRAWIEAFEAEAKEDDLAFKLADRIATPLRDAVNGSGSSVLRLVVEKGFSRTVAKLIERGDGTHPSNVRINLIFFDSHLFIFRQ